MHFVIECDLKTGRPDLILVGLNSDAIEILKRDNQLPPYTVELPSEDGSQHQVHVVIIHGKTDNEIRTSIEYGLKQLGKEITHTQEEQGTGTPDSN